MSSNRPIVHAVHGNAVHKSFVKVEMGSRSVKVSVGTMHQQCGRMARAIVSAGHRPHGRTAIRLIIFLHMKAHYLMFQQNGGNNGSNGQVPADLWGLKIPIIFQGLLTGSLAYFHFVETLGKRAGKTADVVNFRSTQIHIKNDESLKRLPSTRDNCSTRPYPELTSKPQQIGGKDVLNRYRSWIVRLSKRRSGRAARCLNASANQEKQGQAE